MTPRDDELLCLPNCSLLVLVVVPAIVTRFSTHSFPRSATQSSQYFDLKNPLLPSSNSLYLPFYPDSEEEAEEEEGEVERMAYCFPSRESLAEWK